VAHEQRNERELRRASAIELVEQHPDGLHLAFDEYGLRTTWPGSLPPIKPRLRARTLMDIVVPADHAEIVRTWRAAIRTGTGVGSVRLLNRAAAPVRLVLEDLRETDGVVIAVLGAHADDGSPVPVPPVEPARPRFGLVFQTALGDVIRVNTGYARMLGWTNDLAAGSPAIDYVHAEDQALAVEAWMEAVENGRSVPRRWRIRHRDGAYRWCQVVIQNNLDGPDAAMISEIADVTEEVAARERLDAQELLLNRMAQVVPVGLFQVADDWRVIYANDRLHDILGTATTEPSQRPAALAAADSLAAQLATVVPADRERVVESIGHVLATGADEDVEVEVRPPAGAEPRRCALAVRAVNDRLGNVTGAIVCVSDVTETARRLLALERDLIHRSFHDPVTGLPNRTLLISGIDDAVTQSRESGSEVAVLLIDVDGFKAVNDSLGHGAGDELLRALSDRIRAMVRPADIVARLGGDEFAVLMDDFIDPNYPRRTAEHVLAACAQPIEVDGHLLRTNVSIGIATNATAPGGHPSGTGSGSRRSGTGPSGRRSGTEDLLRDAELAMYRAKAAGKGRFETFEPEMHAAAVARAELETSLQLAIEGGELLLVYQPIHDLATGKVSSAEALVRWRHPVHGIVSPAEFIPLAEETGLIVPLGRQVLTHACAEAARWVKAFGCAAPRVSVNLSSRQMASPTIFEDITGALSAASLDPGQLIIEITESVFMEHSDANARLLQNLRDQGVVLAIDDFGTGYSSLAYLERLPVDILKIDKAFVDRISDGGRHAKLIKGILALSDDLGLAAVAEGIETVDQLHALEGLNCPRGQGFWFSRPVDAEALTTYLETATGTPPGP
jgi:diguanylate cyclase (GGDEF)-like protein/PAS domain S-box-containing protein